MNATPSERDLQIWNDLNEAFHRALSDRHPLEQNLAYHHFFELGVNRVALIRHGLAHGDDVDLVARILLDPGRLDLEEKKDLFDVLVEWSSTGHGLVHVFQDAILQLPREWVLERIESAAEPFLREGTDDEYRRFLELESKLDRNLAKRLAKRAIAQEDPDIKEAGLDFLAMLLGDEIEEQLRDIPMTSRKEVLTELQKSLSEHRLVAG